MVGLIEDYALVSDLHTCALIGRDGSVDWLCVPRFDASACFAALLGTQENGHWRIAPSDPTARTSRRYLGDTLVLETTWETPTGAVRVLDFMPTLGPSPVLVRIIEGVRGQVAMRSEMRMRFDYGHIVPWVRLVDDSLVAVAGPDSLWLDGDVPHRGRDLASYADVVVEAGERVRFVLAWQPSHAARPTRQDGDAALARTVHFWTTWSARCTYTGPYREAVLRSLLTLKALTYLPTGGMIAAATTSLPEQIGGSRNWDYRYCWLRDASFTLQAFLRTGYLDEALDWSEWLVRAVAGSPEQIQIMYGVGGERRLPESELDWLDGYEGSRPVRIGNGAADQQQLDVYGEVIDTLWLARRHGMVVHPDTWQLQLNMLEWLELVWRKPDEGLWEVRGASRQFTHSKVLAWVAFDRAVSAMECGLPGPVERYRALRDTIHAEICERGFDPVRGTFTQSYGSGRMDAALLLLPQLGFLPPTDPRMIATVDAVEHDLAADGFVRRYDTSVLPGGATLDGLTGEEGSFLVCSFWLADALALTGRRERALEVFERLLALRNDVGLLAEEYEPAAGRQLGNVPQAYSHLALVTTALVLQDSADAPDVPG